MTKTHPSFAALRVAIEQLHRETSALRAFCPFPTDLKAQAVMPHDRPAARRMAEESGFGPAAQTALVQAFFDAGPHARWRETYKGTDIGQDFEDRFGCYCVIGQGGAYRSATMAAYLVYMPAGLWYPWHHHPAEELYMVLAGEGVFHSGSGTQRRLGPGQIMRHASNEPHALRTEAAPILCYVLWRNGFGIKPVLTPEAEIPQALGIAAHPV